MKKLLALILALVLAAMPLMSLANQKDDPFARYVSTGNTGKLNVRQSPFTHSDNVIAKLENGTRVVIIDLFDNKTWAVVEFTVDGKEMTGYVQHRYLSTTKPAPILTPRPTATPIPVSAISFKTFEHVEEPYTMLVKPATPGGFVNMRWAPSKAVAVMDKLYADTEVTVLATNKTWAQIYNPLTGYVGFMMLSFLK